MRDMRDPQQLGAEYLAVRAEGRDMDLAVRWAYAQSTDFPGDETCIDRYGSANDVKPKWMEVQVK